MAFNENFKFNEPIKNKVYIKVYYFVYLKKTFCFIRFFYVFKSLKNKRKSKEKIKIFISFSILNKKAFMLNKIKCTKYKIKLYF